MGKKRIFFGILMIMFFFALLPGIFYWIKNDGGLKGAIYLEEPKKWRKDYNHFRKGGYYRKCIMIMKWDYILNIPLFWEEKKSGKRNVERVKWKQNGVLV